LFNQAASVFRQPSAASFAPPSAPVSAFDLAGMGGPAGSFGAPLRPLRTAVLRPAAACDGKIQVVVVDSDAECLRRFAGAVRGDAALHLLETASHSDAAIRCLTTHQPDVMVIEPGISGAFGLALIRHCASRSPETEILVRTQVGDDERVLDAIEAGAAGYVYKDAADDWIVACIHALHEGGALISPGVARRILARFRIRATGTAASAARGDSGFGALEPVGPASTLSEDEIGILRLVACGTGLPEIADVLALAPRAVLGHVKHIYRALGTRSRAGG
jgi:DNA-binding NarL/FixJ family response regulator